MGLRMLMVSAAEAGVKRVVLISPVSVYGGIHVDQVTEATPCQPDGAYGESKYAGEQLAQEIAIKADSNTDHPLPRYGLW